MKQFVFISGNKHKVRYLEQWLGVPVEHQKVDMEELQTLDLLSVVEHKARQAYELVGKPVLVEDVSFVIDGMGRLPGTYVKWFLQEIGPAGLAQLASLYPDRAATARVMYGYYDGTELTTFEGVTHGHLPEQPQSSDATTWTDIVSWNSVFVPEGSDKTFGEMTDEELEPLSPRARAIAKVHTFLVD